MKCVKDKKEVRSLSPHEIWDRLMAFYQLENAPTDEEIQNAHWYLNSALSIIDNKFLRNKVHDNHPDSPCFYLVQAVVFTYDYLALIDCGRCYQKALMVWLNKSPISVKDNKGRRVSIPKELEDSQISASLARVVGRYLDESLEEVPQLLKSAIQLAKESNNTKILKKASTFLSLIEELFPNEIPMGVERKFLELLAKQLRCILRAEVVVKPNCIELRSNNPDFLVRLDDITLYKEETDPTAKLQKILEFITKLEALKMEIISEDRELKPVIIEESEHCKKVNFIFIDKN